MASGSSTPQTSTGGHKTSVKSSEKSAAAAASAVMKFKEIVKDPKSLEEAAQYLYQSLVDDAVLGVFLEIHHLKKTGNLNAIDGILEDDQETSFRIVDMPNFDIFGISTAKKPMDCTCPNCDRPVSAARFAPHLEKCMGMGRNSSRIASRRLASTKESSSSSSYFQANAGSDDEDDDWSEKRRKKSSQNSRNNGSKKNNGKSF